MSRSSSIDATCTVTRCTAAAGSGGPVSRVGGSGTGSGVRTDGAASSGPPAGTGAGGPVMADRATVSTASASSAMTSCSWLLRKRSDVTP